MRNNSFYDKPTEQSKVKASIVGKYFWAWAKVMISQVKGWGGKIGYVDFFAGPGRYTDGSKSTPVLILEKAIEDKNIGDRLVSIFNDVNPKYALSLQNAIDSIPGICALENKPIVENTEVDEEAARILERVKAIPTLFFVDPWGYKGLSLELISSTVKNWGCDCIFFFNYNRINMDIDNPLVIERMNALFGKEQAEELRIRLRNMRPFERELSIIEAMCQSLKERAGQYVLPFCFKSLSGRRSSHHLIFVSKHVRGYQIMKRIMAKESTDSEQGDASFEYNPQPLLFGDSNPLDDLADMLLENFTGRTMTMKQIYDWHNVGTPYLEYNYKDVLTNLEIEGKIQAEPPASKRQKRKGKVTFGPKVKVTFPPKGSLKMATKSKIEWTQSTWNPVRGCTRVSEGCRFCYAERIAARFSKKGFAYEGLAKMTKAGPRWLNKVRLVPELLDAPLRWKTPQLIFVNSMSDLFHDDVPLEYILQVFDTMNKAEQHHFQVLTKRSERLAELSCEIQWPKNVWMGVSVEDQDYTFRIDHLRQTGAQIKFLSLEPLIGALQNLDLSHIDWVIVGGESGPQARPIQEKWVIDIRNQCQRAAIPFFFKQWGGRNKKKTGRLLEGRTWDALPLSYNGVSI